MTIGEVNIPQNLQPIFGNIKRVRLKTYGYTRNTIEHIISDTIAITKNINKLRDTQHKISKSNKYITYTPTETLNK